MHYNGQPIEQIKKDIRLLSYTTIENVINLADNKKIKNDDLLSTMKEIKNLLNTIIKIELKKIKQY
jgi:hypothetical protein